MPRPRPGTDVPVVEEPSTGERVDWERLIDEVLRDPDRLTLLFQPIVSFAEATIVGYETLARFERPTGVGDALARTLSPDQWFLAADALGAGAPFEALVVARCLDLRASVPPDCFLTFNVSPHLVTDPVILDLLLGAGPLHPLVVEFTEHRDVPDLAPLVRLRDRLAGLGGLLALDDAGSGYSGLQQMTRLRPHLIKLDRALVADADSDEVKLALAELLGEFAGRIDAWLLAEGVETWAEFTAFARIGVPLGQGYLFGRPAPPWATLTPQVVARMRSSVARVHLTENVVSLSEPAWTLRGTTADPDGDRPSGAVAGRIGLRLDEHGRPLAMFLPLTEPRPEPPHEGSPGECEGTHREVPVSLRVAPTDDVAAVIQRLMTRGDANRFDPLVCIDERGRSLGIIRVERLIQRLLELRSGFQRPTGGPH
jgi:EAL domain-containing protein (putative c-di-GMP-specific phosphodiesterase class I)